MRFRGRVAWVFPDHFDVDEIVGAENMHITDIEVLKDACMRDFDPRFRQRVAPGDILVAGRNFGYGHPHEQGMMVMRALGVGLVVADSFGLMFERTNRFLGLPLLACPGVGAAAERGETIGVEWDEGRVTLASGTALQGVPPGEKAVAMAAAGGWENLP